MCGIAGIIGENTNEKERVIGDMVSAMLHRGPDDNGYFIDSHVGLGMRRLAIIDLNTGKQPILSQDNKRVIFFNGEIYNYKELREELMEKGCTFKTQGDTEVILNGFITWGAEVCMKLRGMFAFCIYNTETQELFLARDFFGIKPLYYLKDGQHITAFSSEIKSFLSIPDFKPEVNDAAVYNYLSFQYNPLPETFFKGVYKLPPAHYMRINQAKGETEIKKYWSFDFNVRQDLTQKETEKKIFETVKDSVEHHMVADVPVGSFLSGGIDSSVIATLMASSAKATACQSKIKTFTVGFNTLTEGIKSKQTSDFLQTDHTEITIGPEEYFKALPDAVWHFDEPVGDPSAIGLYFLAREARKHVKVVLSGEGADELFGGYNIYLAPIVARRLKWIPKSIVKTLLKIPFEFFGKNYLRRVNQELEDWYIGNASVFQKNEIKKLWTGMSKATFDMKPFYEKVKNLSDSAKMQYIDIHTWLVGDILAKADKMTMAHSLELRVPFLDLKVSELAKTLPDKFKWRRGVTKYLFREAFRGIIPEQTRNRRKLGFPTPVRDWFTDERKGEYELILQNEYVKSNFKTEYIQKLINDHVDKRTDNSRKIYLLLMFALWYNRFIKP